MKCRKSRSSTKLSMEPIHFPRVNLKSPLPDLCALSQQLAESSMGDQTTSEESREPFSCTCKHCGLKFGKHSIKMHEKKCSTKQGQLENREIQSLDDRSSSRPVARIVTIGLGSTSYDEVTISSSLPSRPVTQTLRHSSLRDSGYGLPYVPTILNSQQLQTEQAVRFEASTDTSKHGVTLCRLCGRVVATDRIKVHSRLCKPDTRGRINTSSVKFPSTCNLLKVEQSNRHPKVSVTKPPTVVCYICGREYGTKSISIHEPQCLKKFEAENRKLPINKRKPLPKKLVDGKTKVAQFVSVEDDMVMFGGRSTGHNPYKDLVDETMDFIFQQCYSDFERELVPCKRCGRKFAPDRHKKHEPNCNAKPLSGYSEALYL